MKYNLMAQKSNEELTLVNSQNALNSAILNLKVQMQFPIEKDLDIILPSLEKTLDPQMPDANTLYLSCLNRMPEIKAAEAGLQSSNLQTKMAQGNYAPSIQLYASLSTVYSESAKEVFNQRISGTQVIGVVEGSLENVVIPAYSYETRTISLADQFKDNFGQGAGLNFSWTLFSGMQMRNNVAKARINYQIAEISLTQARNTLLNDITTAVNEFNASLARLKASENNLNAQKLAFDFMEKRYQSGVSNAVEFTTAKNNYQIALTNYALAKYDYLFRYMVINFYSGKPLSLN
jgi:outer membrane protein